ncbi:ABC transporter permease [Mycoplasmopsis agassizii]|uniref:ABC transporter permease n=1 Tax=Mycoplasmopsis agassizii TaxID=33922 RepID=UPI003529A05B
MKKLFKEVFRSFFKNKFTILLLSILAFLTAAVLTVIFNVRSAYQLQYNETNIISGNPDYTVGLEINPSGNLPEKGLYNASVKTYNRANNGEAKKQLLFPNRYQPLSSFRSAASENIYIDTTEITRTYNQEKVNNAFNFNYENDTLTFASPTTFTLYNKVGNNFVAASTVYTIANNTEFTFDENVFLRDLVNIHLKTNEKDQISNVGSIYLNIRTKEATRSFAKSQIWAADNELYTLTGENLANLMGYSLTSNGLYEYNNNPLKTITISNHFSNGNENLLSYSAELTGKFSLSFLATNYIQQANQLLEVNANEVFNLPKDDIKETRQEVQFVKTTYDFNFVDEEYSGIYQVLARKINNGEYPNLKSDYFWVKKVKNYINGELSSETSFVLTRSDLDLAIIEEGATTETNLRTLENLSDISQIQLPVTLGFISDTETLTKLEANFKTTASGNIKDRIVEEMSSYSGASNIGRRQTTTLSTIETANNQVNNYLYHFVNIGDQEGKVAGTTSNVGKLIDFSGTHSLNSISSENTDFYKSEFLPSGLLHTIIERGLLSFFIDPDYVKVNYIWEPVSYFDQFNNVYTSASQKIIQVIDKTTKQVVAGIFFSQENISYVYAEKENGVWYQKESYNAGQLDAMIQKYFVQQNLTISETHAESWAKQSGSYAYLPYYLVTINRSILKEFSETGRADTSAQNIKEGLLKTSLATEGFMTAETINQLVNSGFKSVYENNLVAAVATSRLSNDLMLKFAFDIVYHFVNDYGEDKFENLFTNFLNTLIDKINASSGSLEEQIEFTKTQLKNLNSFVNNFGLDLLKMLPFNLNIDDIFEWVKDPRIFLTSLIEIIRSINFVEYVSQVNDFFNNQVGKKISGRIIRATAYDLVLPLLDNIDFTVFKNEVKKIFNNIDFNKMLNPDLTSSLYQKAVANNGEDNETVKTFFKKLNGGTTANPYSNFADEFSNILDLWNANLFASFLKQNVVYQQLPNFTNTRVYLVKTIPTNALLSSFVSSLVINTNDQDSSNDKTFKNSIIKLLNLSDAGEFNDIIGYIPNFNDNTHIAISDLSVIGTVMAYLSNIKPAVSPNAPPSATSGNNTETSVNGAQSTTSGIVTNLNNWNDFLQTATNLSTKISNETELTNDELNWLINNIDNFNYSTITNKETAINLIQNHIDYLRAYAVVQGEHNFASIANVILTTNADDEIYRQAKNQILKENPVSLIATNGDFNYDVARQSFLAYSFILRLRYLYKDDLQQFQDEYAKYIALFNSRINNGSLSFITGFMNDLNSKTLYPTTSDNIALNVNFKISKALASNRLFTNELFSEKDGIYENSSFDSWFKSLALKTRELILSIKNEFVENVAILASFAEFNPNVLSVFQTGKASTSVNFYNWLISDTNTAITNEKSFEKIYQELVSNEKTSQLFNSLDLSSTLLNTLFNAALPQVTLWFISDVAADRNSTAQELRWRSNLAYLVDNKLLDFSSVTNEDLGKLFASILGINTNNLSWVVEGNIYNVIPSDFAQAIIDITESSASREVMLYQIAQLAPQQQAVEKVNDTKSIAMDYDLLISLGIVDYKNSQNTSKTDFLFFDIQTNAIFNSILDVFTELEEATAESGKYLDTAAYLIKVNDTFLSNNNLEVYNGEIPTNTIEMANFMNENKDKKFVLSINQLPFLIIGTGITSDYIYPVVDENNLRVNTTYQAIVFLNQKGWDRINLNSSAVVKDYLLVKNKENTTTTKSVEEARSLLSSTISDSQNVENVYAATALDSLNPERSLRITTPAKLIQYVLNFNLMVIILLLALNSIAFVFAIRRYVNNKSTVLGILISQGYSKFQIASSTSIFAIAATLVGGVLGYGIGYVFQKPVISLLNGFWTSTPAPIANFDITSFLIAVVLPLVFMLFVLFLSVIILLQRKSINLMSKADKLIFSRTIKKINSIKNRRTIKSKFSVALFFNSFYKLVWLVIGITLTSIVVILSFSSRLTFTDAISLTYENRKYEYRQDLDTPTTEGGAFVSYNRANLENNLYVPIGLLNEADTTSANYFSPGYSPNSNTTNNAERITNGRPTSSDPHVITKASASITLTGATTINPWDASFTQLPEIYRSRINLSLEAIGAKMVKYQTSALNGGAIVRLPSPTTGLYDQNWDNLVDADGKIYSYINYAPDNPEIDYSSFFLVHYDERTEETTIRPITNGDTLYNFYQKKDTSSRDLLRDFLIDGYRRLYEETGESDFIISFAGTSFNPETDETYSYARANLERLNQKDTPLTKAEIKIYGYQDNSRFVSLRDKFSNNLSDALANFDADSALQEIRSIDTSISATTEVFPILVNHVSSVRYNLEVGSFFKVDVQNHVNRFREQILKTNPSHTYYFKVVGINNTYVSDEFISLRNIVNRITGLETLRTSGEVPYNGILTSDSSSPLSTKSIAFYSKSGYYPAIFSYPVANRSELFETIFGQGGLLLSKGFTEEQIVDWLNIANVNSLSDIAASTVLTEEAVAKYITLYDNAIYTTQLQDVSNRTLEESFARSVSDALSRFINWIVLITTVISIVILILISALIINENERNIAIFSILGYNIKEKLRIFLTIFLPYTLLSFTIGVGATYLFFRILNEVLTKTSSLSLPDSIQWWHIVLAFAIVLGIVLFSIMLSFIRIVKIKAITLMSAG